MLRGGGIHNGGTAMSTRFGYCRISTGRQNIERQERNIRAAFPDAVIVREVYTGTKFQGRKELEKILQKMRAGDTIIFLKEPHINTETYKKAITNQITMTGDKVDLILEGVNRYLMELAKEQIRIAFEQAEKEVSDLRQRTKEGIETARLNGKQIGQQKGTAYETQKARNAKDIICRHNRSFGGSLTDEETMRQAGISRKSFYKYKRELRCVDADCGSE